MPLKDITCICPSDCNLKYGVQCSEDHDWSLRAIAFPQHRRITSENDDTSIKGNSLHLVLKTYTCISTCCGLIVTNLISCDLQA